MTVLKDHYDIIVVGAGLQGLAAAQTFLHLEPTLSLLIVDAKSSVGGTWAKEQLYPNLRACNIQGFYEYSDFPMLDADVGVTPGGLLSGTAIHAYMHKFAERYDLLSRTLLDTKVVKAEALENDSARAWKLTLAHVAEGATCPNLAAPLETSCGKLLVATGQTSQPRTPTFAGSASFKRPFIHSVKMATLGVTQILNAPTVNHVTVLGGSKSAHDAVYTYATAGKRVTWLLRNTKGSRRVWLSYMYPQVGPMKPYLEGLLMTRPLSWMGAAPWSDGDGFGGIRWFLHNTALGRFIVRNYFGQMSADTITHGGMLKLKESESNALRPAATLQWYGGQAAILNYDKNFYEVVKEAGVEILEGEVQDLEEGTLILEDGRRIQTDAVVAATGYHYGPSFPILPESKQLELGIPVPHKKDNIFPAIEEQADVELFRRFPELLNSPSAAEKEQGLTPWRLWRFIAPPSQAANGPRNLVFLTNAETFQNALKSELVALWAYAYLNDKLSVKAGTENQVRYDATLWSRFGWWIRPLGKQGKTGDMMHEGLAFYDCLMLDMGLPTWRKGWGLFGEIFWGYYYKVKDYKGVKEEWAKKYQNEMANGHKEL